MVFENNADGKFSEYVENLSKSMFWVKIPARVLFYLHLQVRIRVVVFI